MINVGELRKGVVIELDNKTYRVLEYQHIKMGRGGAQARLKLQDVRTKAIFDRTFSASERFVRSRVEHRPAQYLYNDGDNYYFMDQESYEQRGVSREVMGDSVNYLKDGMQIELAYVGEEPIAADLPPNVVLRVEETDPGFKGDTATGGTKPARTETGLVVNVPLFVNTGDLIRVRTTDGTYLERA
ncbi:MAG TPA: elongation factor P [Chloroflexota bacterium]|nr:elongation factor P [Chloroflexota bacterium]